MERSRFHLLHEHRILLFEQPDVLPPSLDTRHANMLDLGDLLLDNRLPPPLDRPKLLDTRQPLLLDIPKLLDSPRLPPLDRPKRLDNRRPPPLDNARQPVFLQNPPTITQPYSEKKHHQHGDVTTKDLYLGVIGETDNHKLPAPALPLAVPVPVAAEGLALPAPDTVAHGPDRITPVPTKSTHSAHLYVSEDQDFYLEINSGYDLHLDQRNEGSHSSHSPDLDLLDSD